MCLDDLAGEAEAQSGSADVPTPGFIAAVEAGEYLVAVLGPNARARVLRREPDPLPAGSKLELDEAASEVVLYGVGREVLNHLLDEISVRHRQDIRGDVALDSEFRGQNFGVFCNGLHQPAQVQRAKIELEFSG